MKGKKVILLSSIVILIIVISYVLNNNSKSNVILNPEPQANGLYYAESENWVINLSINEAGSYDLAIKPINWDNENDFAEVKIASIDGENIHGSYDLKNDLPFNNQIKSCCSNFEDNNSYIDVELIWGKKEGNQDSEQITLNYVE
ncbi:hypothetical protein AB3N04_00285 (plasmid) [Alkalihalophilus sp. As8PL]|uniref:Uncharacterized protein n=1 Tax=Alkalihalophilus sp. As8PL TaxID=3237103 RepID=A0AB39BN78_9BACI